MKPEHNCPCCTKPLDLVKKGGFDEFLCKDCDHTLYVSPLTITAADYEDSEKYSDYYAGKPPFLWYHKRALKAARQLGTGSRVLDFGCYDGFFVKRMFDAGIDAFGCDWNGRALTAGKERFGLAGRLSRDGDGKFDAVVALEVIEHFEDPNVFMNIVSEKLIDGGALILSCPNKNAVYRPSTDAPPHHFSRFSTNSLETILKAHGFSVEKHDVEYSFLQMTRNFIGDRIRSASTNITDQPQQEKPNSVSYQVLRKLANRFIPAIGLAAKPLDWIMHLTGQPYIAQFVVARKTR